jgi:PAS domain S-box-containing protein
MNAAMFAATLQAAATLLLSAGLAAFVAVRPSHTGLRSRLLGLLGALMAWSAGVIWRFTAADDASAFAGFVLGWLGIAALPPLWLLLGAHYARVTALEENPRLAAAAIVPSVLAWLALASNDAHHLFLREFTQRGVVRGPLFYAWLCFAYPCIVAGVGLFLLAARRTFRHRAWMRFAMVCVAALLPSVTSLLFVFQVVPLAYDPTPMALGVSVVALTFGIFRLQFLDALPLARRDVIDHLRDGVLIADPDGAVLDANPAAMRVLGQTLAELQRRTLEDVLIESAADTHRAEQLSRALLRLEPDSALDTAELLTRDERCLELAAKCLRGPGGGVLGRFVLLRDRTQELRTERRLRQSQRLETVGSLAAGVAHEVNNPLAFVRANLGQLEQLAGLAAKRAADPADAESEELAELPQIVAECVDGIERIGRIVDALRRFSRAPGEDFGPVDLNRVVQESLRLVELHRTGPVAVEAWLDPSLPPVQGSAQRLTQVFVNLLLNAKQALAGRGEGRVTVRTRRLDDVVEAMVSDDGPGVPAALRDRIFDPFFTTKGPEEGTGLGLSIAYDIVREHGGVIELHPSPLSGAVFVLHLPVDAAERAALED